ncbi:MAG: helix-turn-helix domain-containing protein [candidate division KSB1 bacterium]|nr:helix-turn-helix domain-containing protein [candidate division KSB1 bacterium]
MSLEQAYQALKAIGFSDYESRAYCALLSQSPSNGYQIASRGGIPRAKVYEVLQRLVSRGAAVRAETADRDAKVYVAVDPKTLIDNIQNNMNQACDQAQSALQHLQEEPDVMEILWRVTSLDDLVSRAHSLVDGAQQTLHVALWAEEFDAVYPALLRAAERDLRMAVILYSHHDAFSQLQNSGAGAVLHSANKRQMVPELGRQFLLAADRRQCITGSIFDDGTLDGVFSMNRGLVSNTVDLVNHEIYVERITHEVGDAVFKRYGRDMKGLNSFDAPG